MALEPSLWGTLPHELLHLVFARLPVTAIGQLRVLSKEWKRNVDCNDSEFNQVLDETAPLNMLALLSPPYFDVESVSGKIDDVKADKWHVPETCKILENVAFFDGVDGGLVCYVSKRTWRDNKPSFVIVMNPVTKQKRQLPPLLSMVAEKTNSLVTLARIVRLAMDRETKEYKVFVVSSTEKGIFAQVYDSHIKEWMVVEATQGHIFGWDYVDVYCRISFPRSLCVYNCADGTLQQFNETNIASGLEEESGCFDIIEDHLFVLHKEASPGVANLLEDGASMLQKYCISEFHLPEKATAWVKLRGLRPPANCICDTPHGFTNWRLWGCNGFLIVYGGGSERVWQYNLSTCEWGYVPAIEEPLYYRIMFETSWSAIS